MNGMFKYFVWIYGLRGPEGQVWMEQALTREGKPIHALMQVRIRADDDRSLDQLKLAYPYEAKE
jgi:hypothetical protein